MQERIRGLAAQTGEPRTPQRFDWLPPAFHPPRALGLTGLRWDDSALKARRVCGQVGLVAEGAATERDQLQRAEIAAVQSQSELSCFGVLETECSVLRTMRSQRVWSLYGPRVIE